MNGMQCARQAFMRRIRPVPVMFLDYDGTLTDIVMNPEDAIADGELKDLLLKVKKRFETYIVTGRGLDDIQNLLGIDMDIIALHGAVGMISGKRIDFVPDMDRYIRICDDLFRSRDDLIREFPGLRIYNKNGNLLFHFGRLDVSMHESLFHKVRDIGRETGMDIYLGKLIIELRVPGIDKGITISRIRAGRNALIAGDDTTDEEAFRKNSDSLRISVGRKLDCSDCVLPDPESMRRFLQWAVQIPE